jgi:hypothetical protein
VAAGYRLQEARDVRVFLRSIFVHLAAGEEPAERCALAAEYAQQERISEERVDAAELAGIVQAASAARNGWRVILSLCKQGGGIER